MQQHEQAEVCLDYQRICRKALGTLRRRGVTAYIEAEELTSVGCVALAEARPTTEALGVTIARRAMIDAARRHEVRERGRVYLPEATEPDEDTDATDTLLSSGGCSLRPEERRADLWEAMRALPAREYQVVTLHFWGGKSQAEIGAELGVSQRTVSTILENAKKVMRELLNSDSETITYMRGNSDSQRAVLSGRKDAA